MRASMCPRFNPQVVAFTTSTQSAALGAGCRYVRVCSTAACWIAIGTNPTADKVTGVYVPANLGILFGATTGEKIAVLQDSSGGNLSIVEGKDF